MPSNDFLPQKGACRNLIAYQKAKCVYDATFLFTRKFLSISDRTVDQMLQAARSGKQNIVEGCACKNYVIRNRAKASECSKGQFAGIAG